MAQKKETMMMLKVDLDCARCYKKVKKLLCSIPQVKDQIYDEKKNTVKIKVVGCCPEKIRDKICCKGGKTIKDIQIIPPKPPTPPPTPPPPPKCCKCRTTCPCNTGCRCGCICWCRVSPPPPPPDWWVCSVYRPDYYYINCENPSACIIM